jgi:methyl-accepting chemotaxis protein
MVKALSLALDDRKEEAKDVVFKEIIPIQSKLLADFDALLKLYGEIVQKESSTDVDEANAAKSWLYILVGVGFLVGIASAVIIGRSVTKPVRKAVEGLSKASEEVASAADQVSVSSQSLAEGASEQAAAIEETSSSLEEISSMTRQNAENAGQAKSLMDQTALTVAKTNESMIQLTGSMHEISKVSEETQKIIKTIDEIAFQTNLLALNAAVEAARAGEAGAGFAVVADEVRNLAMRAAEAAKNTALLIEGTVKTVKVGSEVMEKTRAEFSGVSSTVTKAGELVGEIAAASNEQAQGIEQVNRAVSEMEKVVQQNAASAEESASASEEMSAQAACLLDFVKDLVKVVGGEDVGMGKSHLSNHATGSSVSTAPVRTIKATKAVVKAARQGNGAVKNLAGHAPQLLPHQVIPFEDKGFKEF